MEYPFPRPLTVLLSRLHTWKRQEGCCVIVLSCMISLVFAEEYIKAVFATWNPLWFALSSTLVWVRVYEIPLWNNSIVINRSFLACEPYLMSPSEVDLTGNARKMPYPILCMNKHTLGCAWPSTFSPYVCFACGNDCNKCTTMWGPNYGW